MTSLFSPSILLNVLTMSVMISGSFKACLTMSSEFLNVRPVPNPPSAINASSSMKSANFFLSVNIFILLAAFTPNLI